MKLGICLGTGPGEIKTRFALELAKECQNINYEVDFFFFGNGIYNALESNSVKCQISKVKDISEKKSSLNVCSVMAKYRGVGVPNIAEYVDISSLLSFSYLIETSDVVISTK